MSKKITPIETLQKHLAHDCPDATTSLDKPRKQTGVWFLDFVRNGHAVQVQWQAKNGFGVSATPNPGYGTGPDEVYQDEMAIRYRVLSLLLSQTFTSPPPPVSLAEIRRKQGFSQSDIADTLGKKQAAVSRLEGRDDWKISSLREYCRSLGAELEVTAKFPNGEKQPIAIEESDAKAN